MPELSKLLDELDESEKIAEQFGWISEEEADEFIDKLIKSEAP